MATSSYFGRNSFVGFGPETTAWGTAAAEAALTRPIISCSMLRQIEKVERPNLIVGGIAGLRKGHIIAKDSCTGSLEIEATYDNCGYLIKEVLGAASSDTSGTPEVHTYTMGDVPAQGTTLFLQRGTDDNYERFEGCVFSTFTASCSAGEIMTFAVDIIGETSTSSAGNARHDGPSLAFSSPSKENLVLHHHAGTLSWRGQTITLIDFEYKIENGLAERQRLGSVLTKQPVQSDYRSVTMSVTFETDDATYQKFIADEVGDAIVIFSNGASSGDEREMKFTLNEAFCDTYSDEIGDTGLVTASVVLKAQSDGDSGQALGTTIIVKNENSTAVHAG
jgi:hypothetical protein